MRYRTGDTIPGHGTVQQVSLTAYRIDGRWVPFVRIHDLEPAQPLVDFPCGTVITIR